MGYEQESFALSGQISATKELLLIQGAAIFTREEMDLLVSKTLESA